MGTSRDIAEAAGVSPATVSRVLHGSDRVNEATRERVLAVMRELGYRPNAAARNLRTQRTGTIGIVISDITNPFYPQLLESLTADLADAEQHMILWNSVYPGEGAAVAALRERTIDGLVFTTVVEGSAALEEALRYRAPVVLLNRTVDGAACDQVGTENEEGGRGIAAYLHHHGHRRIAYIAGPSMASTSREREHGFRTQMAELGHAVPDELVVAGEYSHDAGRRAMRRLLALDDPPTAVAAANDVVAFGALSGARSMGRRVPEDVWVVGYDDIPMAGWESFDLTTVRQPIQQMTASAVELLLDRIEHPDAEPRHRRYPNDLIVRGSTAHAPLLGPGAGAGAPSDARSSASSSTAAAAATTASTDHASA